MSFENQVEFGAGRVFDLTQSIKEVDQDLRSNGHKLAVVCDDGRYVGLLERDQVAEALRNNPALISDSLASLSFTPSPVLPVNSTPLVIRRFLQDNDLPVVPFTDRSGRLAKVLEPEDAMKVGLYENAAVTMAGGLGLRLRPITENIPKPMVPLVDGKLLDRILDHQLDCGIYRHYVAVHFLKEQVMDYLGDGNDRGIEVEYLIEKTPLGTAGSLRSLIGKETLPVVVNNGDVITNQRFGDIIRYHNQQRSQVTILCKEMGVDISYGVIECEDDGTLASLSEKPRLSYLVNTGIYIINPEILELVPDRPCNMTELIGLVKKAGGKVSVFQTREYWRDVGTIDCYAQVMKDIRTGLVRSFSRPTIRSAGNNGRRVMNRSNQSQ